MGKQRCAQNALITLVARAMNGPCDLEPRIAAAIDGHSVIADWRRADAFLSQRLIKKLKLEDVVTQKEACTAYMNLLRDTEELTMEQRHLARESFNEGWLQCELARPSPESK